MSLEDALMVLNKMQAEQVIDEYAIGGAVAAFLYIEPGTTFDLDVFIAWEPGPGGLLDLGPIYSDLMGRGFFPSGEAVRIEDWDVQFLPPATPLVTEALHQSAPIEIGGVPTKVFTEEHLMAICLETGRPKDFARLVQFAQEGNPDERVLTRIFDRHNLQAKWASFRKKFLEPL